MGRKRIHTDEATRKRLFRQAHGETLNEQSRQGRRLVKVAAQLHDAAQLAAAAGDDLAAACIQSEAVATLERLTEHFHEKAGTPPEERPRSIPLRDGNAPED